MSFVKSKLKAAREFIANKNFAAARDAARQVLDYEPENYTAHVFLGLSLLNLGETDESEQVYRKAAGLSPDLILAWQGLSQLYEKVDNSQKLLDTLENITQIHQKADDAMKAAETLQKIIVITRSLDDQKQLVKVLSYLLPDSPFYPVLSGLPPPDPTNPMATTILYVQSSIHNELPVLEEIVGLVEAQETAFMEREVERRRTRLNAGSLKEVRNEIGREIWAESRLPCLYSQILNHPNSTDELRRTTESKLLQYKVNYLHALPLTEEYQTRKRELGREIDELIRGIILLKIPDELAWTLYVEEQDCETMADYDYSTMKQMAETLPNSALTEAFTCYYEYISEGPSEHENESEENEEALKREEDPFDSIMNIFARAQGSMTICRIVGEVYLKEEDYQNASSVAKTALELLKNIERESGKTLHKSRVGLQSILTLALAHLFPPKYHQRALTILNEALSISCDNIRCLLTQGYILQTAQDWIPAAQIYQKIVDLLPGDLKDGLKAKENQGWCHWQATRELSDVERMKDVLCDLKTLEGRNHDAARCLWRIGRCYWDLGGSQREEAYSFFIASLKYDPTFAAAFTSLGFFYASVASPSDPVRASKCFQKAFELDPRESSAARKLAEGFAEDREWDLVEVVARRTIEGEGGVSTDSASRVIEFIPTNSWAWKAVGLVEMNRENYLSAIQAFQNVLRAEPEDPLSWSRLGEAYAKAGRHAAAIKALHHALELDPQNWLCSFLIAELKSKIGLYQEAIPIFEELLTQRPDELSALVALAQAHFSLGQTQFEGGYHIRAEASFLDAIEVAMLILERYPGFRGVSWKIISDATLQLCFRTVLQNEPRVTKLSSALLLLLSKEGSADPRSPSPTETSGPNAFLNISIQACHLRVSLNHSLNIARGAAWYDLAIGLKTWCKRVPDVGLETERRATEAMTNALKEEPTNGLYWNIYGNMQFSDHPKVAQHAYIKALELNPKDVSTWTNLGLLYYHYGDLELANEALYRAQVVDPDFPLAWLGQALVALGNGHEFDAYTLLTHAITLAPNLPDVDAEYGIRVFHKSKLSRRRTEDEVDLIPSFFALNRYCSRRPDDPLGLHLLALTCERIGHIELAISSVEQCIGILEATYEDSENSNVERQYTIGSITLGRLLLSAGQHERSLESFQTSLGLLSGNEEDEKMTEPVDYDRETMLLRVQAHLGLALAHFMLQDYSSSLTSSQAALSIVGNDLALRAQIMILMTQTLWALGTDEMKETAKAQLLEYIAVDSENITAIDALASMGILTEDENLIDAALSEVLGLSVDQRQELDVHRDVDYLVVQHHLSKGRIGDATSVAQREVFLEPGKPEPRMRLANLMIQSKRPRVALSLLSDAVSTSARDDLALAAAALRLHSVALCGPDVPTQNLHEGLREIQRAVMLRPFHLKSWQALGYIRSCMGQ